MRGLIKTYQRAVLSDEPDAERMAINAMDGLVADLREQYHDAVRLREHVLIGGPQVHKFDEHGFCRICGWDGNA